MFATLLPFASGSVRAQTPELQPTFTRLSGNQGSLNWNHVAGRVYFGKFSMDLQSWTFAPIVALGTGAVVPPYLLDTDGGRYFVRLRYTVATNYTQGEAGDLDGDGISNLDEMTYFGTDPLVSNDAEGDGTLVSGRKLAGLLIRMPQWSA